MMIRAIWVLVVVFGLCGISSGCKGKYELNELYIVHAIAIDKGKSGLIKLTAEIAKVTPPGQNPKGMQDRTFLLSIEGKSLFEAARLMRIKADRTLLWGHTSAILFSKNILEAGIENHIDGIRRLKQFRNSTLLYVTEGEASEVLQVSTPQATITSQALKGLTEGGESTALTQQVRLIDVYQDLVNHYNDISLPAVQITNDPNDRKIKLLQTVGLFVFHGSNLKGHMRGLETKGFLRAVNKMDNSSETVPCGTSKTITFENINNRSQIEIVVDNQLKPLIRIKIYADLNITNMECPEITINPDTISEMEIKLNVVITDEVQRFIQYSQKHKVDLLGIGERIHRRHPTYWGKMKQDWIDIYASSEFTVEVHSRVDHTNFIF
ncbi:Ger(x)C family spore germination protein [Paenibacillus eucommiae]|uniref:Ger(X)C family germination protein n=1 Tax=Paenibacillus eucommiae TaxID=1355755 RepID=A0ABS4IQU2_9BACL|nr:Ger(x)C family spore germination protein [Paenibacillus eucommiae]MBP1989944.1 Ger(x)C family germination protein [Paenibacillus eucommiae]